MTFLSTLSLRRATNGHVSKARGERISIHALLAESDTLSKNPVICIDISIHALLAESDGGSGVGGWPHRTFLSTLSLRRATLNRPPPLTCRAISIHALLAESDYVCVIALRVTSNFYPRSPCGERPPMTLRHCTTYLFLSTLSLRRATWAWTGGLNCDGYFYPRSPCGERQR